jgi:CcmD family protein
MNPGPTLGLIAVVAAYAIVFGALLVYLQLTSSRRKKLDRRRAELRDSAKTQL